MNPIRAVAFDLFNTLITVEPQTMPEAQRLLMGALEKRGFSLEVDAFTGAYRTAAITLFKQAHKDGRETHNRFWIALALNALGYPEVTPEDPRIAEAVEAYFSAFFKYVHLIPGTLEMLASLGGRFRLGLLSNFTHHPVAKRLLDTLGILPFFHTVVISGEIGYRKPHPIPFQRLVQGLGHPAEEVMFLGDDAVQDILGARDAGLFPVWMTYVRDHGLPLVPGISFVEEQDPDPAIPRISTWDDLFSLIETMDG